MRPAPRSIFSGITIMIAIASTLHAHNIPADSPVADALHRANDAVAKIVAVPAGQRNFDNTLGALDDMIVHLENDTQMLMFLAHVSTDAAERKLGRVAEEHVSNWMIDLSTREDLYAAVKAFADLKPDLHGEQKRYLEHVLRDYRRAAMDLPRETREQLNELRKKISKLAIDFQTNIAEDDSRVPLTREELAGMDDEFLATLPRTGDIFLCGLDNPTFNPIADLCDNEETRAKVWILRHRKGGPKNVAILEQILKLRADAAHMLGYASDVDYETETRMAGNAAAVKKFYEQLRPLVRKVAQKECDEFTAAKRAHTGRPDAQLQPWDRTYYETRLKNERFHIDPKIVQQYFPLERVMDGLFSVTQKLYGLEYREITDQAASKGHAIWHPDVRLFEVYDKESGELMGEFFIDLFPRENKYSHAAQFGLRSRKHWSDGAVQKPLVALVCNFTKPTRDKPSLLTHDEVETFFHEFGHCLHSILTEVRYARFSGTAVARDFVEAPSQMFENWVWDADVLDAFAAHYQTGERLPRELLANMVAARNFGRALWSERQIFYGLLDLTLHLDDDGVLDSTRTAHEIFSETQLFPAAPETYPQASFGHLMGYNSGYYGYMWSLVYAADMFERFRELGMLNPEVGMYYRKKILSRGGTMDEMEIVKDYLGREPRMEPFLKMMGLN